MKFTFLLAITCLAQERQLHITIDDAPRGGDRPQATLRDTLDMTRKLSGALKGIPVTVFINSGQARRFGEDGVQQILQIWRKQGAELGNHTFSHPDLNNIPLSEYQAEIIKAEPAIRKARGGTKPRYFRHCFLHTGPDSEKREGLAAFLKEQAYVPAPVTIDTSDWLFASASGVEKEYLEYMERITAFFEQRAQAVLGRDIAQILLIHANQLNADTMPELLTMFRKRGYRFVSLDQALEDPAYQLEDGYTGGNGLSWLHRWALGKGQKPVMEPPDPQWLLDRIKQSRK